MNTPPARRTWPPHPRLVPHDITLTRPSDADTRSRVSATVECARRQCTLEVEVCAHCPRFARIETHEAGYVLLCRPLDVAPEEACIADAPDEEEP